MFDFDLTNLLKTKISKISKKDKKKVEIISKKIRQIVSCDHNSIDHYKNLRDDMKDLKRVHKHFVLTFKVNKNKNFILFVNFDHHDRVY